MADDLILMSEGRILQRGTPEDCYLNPVSIDAARLLGEAEVLPARIVNGVAETAFGDVPAAGFEDGAAQVMVRPEGFVVGSGIPVEVSNVRFVGQAWRATLTAGGASVSARLVERPTPQLYLRLDGARTRVFPALSPIVLADIGSKNTSIACN